MGRIYKDPYGYHNWVGPGKPILAICKGSVGVVLKNTWASQCGQDMQRLIMGVVWERPGPAHVGRIYAKAHLGVVLERPEPAHVGRICKSLWLSYFGEDLGQPI